MLKIGAGLIVGLGVAWVITSDSSLAKLNWPALGFLFAVVVLLSLWQVVLIWQWPWRKRFVRRWVLVLPLLWAGVLGGLWLVDAQRFGDLVMWIVLLPLLIMLGAGWAVFRARQPASATTDTPDQIEARLQAFLATFDTQAEVDPQQEMTNRYNAGVILNNLGRFAKSIPHLERTRTLAAEIGNRSLEANALNYIGLAQLELDPPAALETFRQVHATFDALNRQRTGLQRLFGLNDLRSFDAMALCNLSGAYLKLDQPEAAHQAVQAAADLYAAGGLGGLFAVNLLVQQGRVLHGLGQAAAARQRFDQAQTNLAALTGVSRRDRQTLQTWLDTSRAALADAP